MMIFKKQIINNNFYLVMIKYLSMMKLINIKLRLLEFSFKKILRMMILRSFLRRMICWKSWKFWKILN